jgi:hypothetical protein
MDNTIKHFGVPGMKWGVRKYQDASGRLTAAGKSRYARDPRREDIWQNVSVDLEKAFKSAEIHAGTRPAGVAKELINDRNTNSLGKDSKRAKEAKAEFDSLMTTHPILGRHTFEVGLEKGLDWAKKDLAQGKIYSAWLVGAPPRISKRC